MKINYHQSLPETFPPEARVWIYQSDRNLLSEETEEITRDLESFCSQWKSHGATVMGTARVLMNRFVVVIADERAATVSGCATDSSVKAVQAIEKKYGMSLFDRMQIAFLGNNGVFTIPLNEISEAFQQGRIQPETPVFNNSITTLKELREEWTVPAKDSWLKSKIKRASDSPSSVK